MINLLSLAGVLPPGFDPSTGRINLGTPNTHYTPPQRPRYSSPSPSYVHRPSFWDRVKDVWYAIDDFIIGIGNWFADHLDDVVSWVTSIGSIIAIIWAAVWVIGVFSNEGFIWGVLAIIGAFFIIGIAWYGIVILGWIVWIAFAILRGIFLNIWTLLLTIGIIAGIAFYNNMDSNSYTAYEEPSVEAIDTSKPYICTAKSLNVRKGPGTSYGILGTFSRGDTVRVVAYNSTFAVINYNGLTGYVSGKFIVPAD